MPLIGALLIRTWEQILLVPFLSGGGGVYSRYSCDKTSHSLHSFRPTGWRSSVFRF